MSDHDHPDTDMTDPHGEAEALRKENERLREELASGSFYKEADIDALMARAEAAEAALAELRTATRTYSSGSASVAVCPICDIAGCHHLRATNALAASRAPDPAANAGSCQPVAWAIATIKAAAPDDLEWDAEYFRALYEEESDLDRAFAIIANAVGRDELVPRRALPAAPVAEAQPTIGGAELDALVARLRGLARDMKKDAPEEWYEHEDVTAAADAITSLRAQPDWKAQYDTAMQSLVQAQNMIDKWKAMAERLGEVLRKQRELTPKAMRAIMWQGRDGLFIADDLHKSDDAARAALSDLAKMKGE